LVKLVAFVLGTEQWRNRSLLEARGMSSFLAIDDAILGAPTAECGQNEAFVNLAPQSCVPVAGSVPPKVNFHRSDYTWLAFSLAAYDDSNANAPTLDLAFYGMHTLKWSALHEIVERAVLAGFTVGEPSTVEAAVVSALAWSSSNRGALRVLTDGDFEPLPVLPRPAPPLWWRQIAFSSWAVNGMLHPVVHAMGFSGRFWQPASRAPDSRLHLSLLLTHEFITVSSSLPQSMYGDPTVRYYITTMPPLSLLVFPPNAARLLWFMNVRWGYQQGDASQVLLALNTLLPTMLRECPNLTQYLTPAQGGSQQVSAYLLIAKWLAPSLDAHKLETVKFVDSKLAGYMGIIAAPDGSLDRYSPETKAYMLKSALDAAANAVSSAPVCLEGNNRRGEMEGPAVQQVLRILMELHRKPLLQRLESSLLRVWNVAVQDPVEVFRLTLESRSVTCIAILFGNLTGVKSAGPLFDILETASLDRLNYFSTKLATPRGQSLRPDHTLWFTYSEQHDKQVRSPDLAVFSQLNLFELGAHLRKLKLELQFDQMVIPKHGTQITAELFDRQLHLLTYLGPWFEALGFSTDGPFSFSLALQSLVEYCQQGAHLQASSRDAHVTHMRELYVALVKDLHSGFNCFWNRRPPDYTYLVPHDAMFREDGIFYGTHRQLLADIKTFNVLTRFNYAPIPVPAPGSAKRPAAVGQGSSTDARVPSAKKADQTPRPDYSKVGSFAGSVSEDSVHIVIGATKYVKALILDKLKVKPEDTCLASFLCKKGAAACPLAGQPGHEAHDSALHVFPAAWTTLRQSFDQSPYRIFTEPDVPGPRPGNANRGNNKGKSRRSSSRK